MIPRKLKNIGDTIDSSNETLPVIHGSVRDPLGREIKTKTIKIRKKNRKEFIALRKRRVCEEGFMLPKYRYNTGVKKRFESELIIPVLQS